MDYRKTHGRRNWKYQQNERHNKRDLKVAKSTTYPSNFWVDWSYDENGNWNPTGRYIKRPKNSNSRVYCKKQTSHKIRKTKTVINGNMYQKYFDMWWALY